MDFEISLTDHFYRFNKAHLLNASQFPSSHYAGPSFYTYLLKV